MTATLLPLIAVLAAAPTPDHLWIEGESARVSGPFQTGGWGRDEYLSGRKWLFAAVDPNDIPNKVPEAGLTASYEFEAAGGHEVWARIGYEFARSPFRWRIDRGEWKTVSPDELTTDLMAIADFAEVAWLKLGTAELAAGKHTLEVNVPRATKPGHRVLFALDCLCLSRKPFRPNGPYQPDAEWRTPLDREAAGTMFEFPATAKNASATTRRELPLGGTWQVARLDENEISDRTGPVPLPENLDDLTWKGIRVPGDKDAERPDLAYCHRYLYRTRVNVPAEFAGRSFVLRFPNNALISTIYVNGKQVGFSQAPCAAFDCDATAAVKPGSVNEVAVGIKDLYYAVTKTGDGKSCRYLFNFPHERFHNSGGLGPTRFADFPVLFKVRRNGILETPSLVVGGPVYTADVFCRPSVSQKQLGLDVTVHNPTDKPAEVEVRNAVRPKAGGEAVKTFAPKTITVPAGRSETIPLAEPWADPHLWWPTDPHLYEVVTTLAVGGKPVDELATTFGFREWGISGRSFTLNGVPWHFRADLQRSGPQPGKAADEAVAEWRANGQNMMRFWGDQPWTGASQKDTLDFFDRAGVPVRRSGIFDGEVASYQLVIDGKPNTALFDNWRHQLEAWVKAERNHPSVFVWSLENEVTYINARNFGWLKQVEPEIKKAAELVAKLDPTRPVMVDGGDALMDQSLPVAGNHYLEKDKRDYPDEAYTLAKAYARHTEPGRWDPWPIPKDKPLFLGESFFANGSPPAAYAEVSGESAFLGRREAAKGVTVFARMLSEGYRWHGVAAFHFWFAQGAGQEHHKVWQPVAVLCREWDTAFPGGAKVARTLKVFNDTRSDEPITVHWLFQTKNTSPVTQRRGTKILKLPPGESREYGVEIEMPAAPADGRVEGEFVLTCVRGGKEVFRDVKPCRVLGSPTRMTGSQSTEVALWDPAGKVTELIGSLTPFTPVKGLDGLPAGSRVLVVGPDAVTPELATDPRWTALAARGLRVLVLDQANPLHYQALPADLEPTTFTGRIGFPENPTHPVFAGLGRPDFFCWSGDHVVYRNAYRKPTRGGRSLVQCDAELSCTALVEVPTGEGVLLLSQLAVGAKPTDPVARRVTANLLRYAASYKRQARPTAAVLPENDPRLALLAASGLKFTRLDDPAEALDKAEVVILDATPANLAKLPADRVRAFAEAGSWLVLWGVTPDGLADFNKIVGFDHVIRPFKRERVTFPPDRDPLTAGLSLRDVALESAEKIYPWAGDRYPADDTFTHVVDLDDPAPFVRSPKYAHGWSQMTNGLTSTDSWKFIFYHDQAQAGEYPSWAGELPKAEEITGLSVVVNAHYRTITRMRVVFDGDRANALTLDLKPEAELRQDFDVPARRCKTIALEPVAWTEGPKPVIGIDNLWLRARRPADFRQRVVPLLNIGALVKYPVGKGGLLLCQVRVGESESNPENAGKKRTLVAALLRNLGAEFAAERVVVPGEGLTYSPVPLGEKCNLFLTSDRGWPFGPGDLAQFPVGDQKFAGVWYQVRDFRTSPLPAAVGLTRGTKAVTGIPVGRATDALFFLHTYHLTKPLKPGEQPEAFRYTVRYADGQAVEVPVQFGRGVGSWAADRAKPLPEAAVAWSAPLPTGKRAVVYQMQWTNPRPGHEIARVDVSLSPADPPGAAVVLGITAAVARK